MGRRPAVLVALAATLLAAGVGPGWAVGIGLVLLATVVVVPERAGLARRWPPDVLGWLPVGAGALIAAVMVPVAAAAVVGIPLWGDGRAVATLMLLAAAVGAVGVVRGGRIALASRMSAIAWAPAAVVAALHVLRMVEPTSFWSRPAWIMTDWVNHTAMTVDLVVNGRLEHSAASQTDGEPATVYPRAIHALLAWIVAARGHDGAADAWEPALAAVFGGIAVAAVLAVAAGGLVAGVLARRAGLSMRAAAVAALATEALMLHPVLHDVLWGTGFLTTSAAAGLLLALALVLDAGTRRGSAASRLLLVIVLAVALLHVWQPLVVAAVPALLIAGRAWWSAGRPRLGAVALVAATAIAVCAPLALVTLSPTGGAAVGRGDSLGIAPVPVVLGVALVSVLAVALTPLRRTRGARGLAGATIVLALLGAVLAVVLPATPAGPAYYAEKVLWHAMAVALPVAVVGGIAGLAWAWRRWCAGPSGIRPLPAISLVAPLALLAAVLLGRLSYGWSATAAELTGPAGPSPQVPLQVATVDAIGPGTAVIPYLLHPQGWQLWLRYDDAHAARIAQTMGASTPDRVDLSGRRVGALCTWLRAHPDSLRLTGPRLGQDELVAAGCPVDVVRPDLWQVLTPPSEWWARTRWAATGGAPDPTMPVIPPPR